VTYGSEALDTTEHLGLILGSQKAADVLLDHFGSLAVLARASVEELLPFVSKSKALRLVSSLRMGAVALREERQSLTIDSPEAIADLCSEMRFLDRESLRVVLLNTKQHLIKICTVSQGSVNESLGHPREIFKPVITYSAYSFILVHTLLVRLLAQRALRLKLAPFTDNRAELAASMGRKTLRDMCREAGI
jgi:DNA repair protein RadC